MIKEPSITWMREQEQHTITINRNMIKEPSITRKREQEQHTITANRNMIQEPSITRTRVQELPTVRTVLIIWMLFLSTHMMIR